MTALDRRTFIGGALAAGLLACASAPRARPPARKLRVLVLGGTGYIGPAIVEVARAHGHTVTLFNRGKSHPEMFPDVEQLRGDRDGHLEALRGRTWDAVIDDAGYVPRVVRQSAELLAPSVGRYLVVSTISVYSDEKTPGQDERAARAKMPADDPKSEEVRKYYSPLKAECEDVVAGIYGERRTIVRPGYIVGPRDPADRLTYWVQRCAQGGAMLAPGDGGDPTQYIDVRDLGAFIVGLVEQDAGGAYNATGPQGRLTMRQLLEGCRDAAGGDAKLVWVPEELLRKNGISPDDEEREWLPLWNPHSALGEVSVARAFAAGLSCRPVLDTARDTLAWWRAQPDARRAKLRAGLEPDKEQAILAQAGGR